MISKRQILKYGWPSPSSPNLLALSVRTKPWMTVCKTVVTPLLTHWSYHSLALSHRLYDFYKTDIKVRLIKSIFHQSVSSGCQNKALYDLLQNCGNSSANTLELPQYCTKPSAISFLLADIWKYGWWSPSFINLSALAVRTRLCMTYCKTVVTPVLTHWNYHSIANALELPQSCTKPSAIWFLQDTY